MARPRSPSPFDVLAGLFPDVSGESSTNRTTAQAKPTPHNKAVAPKILRSPTLAKGPKAHAKAQPESQKAKTKKRREKPKAPAPHGGRAFAYVTTGRLTPKLSERPRQTLAPAPAEPKPLTGQAALDHVLRHVDLTALNQVAIAPSSVSSATAEGVRSIISRGAALLSANPNPDPMGYRVGLDFGTSTTKVVICSDAADTDYALAVPPELQVDEHGRRQEHLWRTCVWFDDAEQRFDLIPSATTRPLLGFKTGLIQREGHRMLAGVSHHAASAAYLALLIAYVIGCDAERMERQGISPRPYSRFHIGVPVACLEDDDRVPSFHRVAQAAFRLAPKAASLTLERVREALSVQVVSTATDADTPYQLFEELAGVVAGYNLTPERSAGPHMIVDIGAATLDVATFYIPDGENPLEVYESGVVLLGAQALECALSAGVAEPVFRAACQHHTGSILNDTRRFKHFVFEAGPGSPPKPMIYVGGGRLSPIYKATYQGYSEAFLAPMRTPGVSRWLERDLTTDAERLLLAWGLAQDPGAEAIPMIRPRSEVVPIVRRVRDWQGDYIGPEVC